MQHEYWIYPTAFSTWDEQEYNALHRVTKSGRFTMGEEVAAFEKEFAAFHGMKYCVMVNSGSSANLLMVAALHHLDDKQRRLGCYSGRAYIPAVAWSTTYSPFMQRSMDITLLDIDKTWNADPDAFREDLRPGSVVVGCSILGNPCYAEAWKKKADQAGATYIEDNCESFGAISPHMNHTGTLGLMNSFSFFYSHQISAVEGGAILTNDKECNYLLRMLRAHGWSRDTVDMRTKHFDEQYDFRLPGYNVRPTEMYAAVARVQLEKQAKFARIRDENLRFFWREAQARHVPISFPHIWGQPNGFGLQFECRPRVRAQVAYALRDAGIDSRLPTGGSYHMHEYGKAQAWQKTPRADILHQAGMFLGNGPINLQEKIDTALNVIKEAAECTC